MIFTKIMYNISRESAYAKLILAYSQTEVEIKDFLNKKFLQNTLIKMFFIYSS